MIEISEQQSEVALEEEFVQRCHEVLVKVMERLISEGGGVLGGLDLVEVTFLNDEDMGRVHGEFMDDPTPTDVITFEHGEILVGAEVAVRQAAEYGKSVEQELVLYGIHGLLHLAGYDDKELKDREVMFVRQEELLEAIFYRGR